MFEEMRKKITVTDIVLLTLEKAIDGYVRVEDFTYHHYRYHYGIPELKKSVLAQAIQRLRLYGYIDLEEYNNKLILKLTESGKAEASIRKVLRDETWDGKWRVVVFDIPEKNRGVRNAFRSKLKSWGFEQWQKSVWISRKNVTKPLREFVKKLKVEKWVTVFGTTNLE